MPNFLVLNGHPEPDGFINDLASSYVDGLSGIGPIRRIDLRDMRFEPVLRRAHQQQALEPDLAAAAQAVLWADHVTWLFPTWWSGPPALAKAFIDRLLTPGFAYRYRGRNQKPEQLLHGRSARFISSMDSPGYWYFLQGRPLHRSFVSGTLGFVGFAPIETTLFHGARFMSSSERAAARKRVAADARRDGCRAARQPRLDATPRLGAGAATDA